jgi:hypothetical protein
MERIDAEFAAAVALLTHPRSPKRRSGAKRLRRLADPRACPAVLAALQHEVRDARTWQTQYQLIMALGACACRATLPYLQRLTAEHFAATMVYVALGDALVRLGRAAPDDPTPVQALLASGNGPLSYGALQAVATLRLKLPDAVVRDIVAFATAPQLNASPFMCDVHTALRQVVAVAAAGWEGPHVEAYLHLCEQMPQTYIRGAAQAALRQQYYRWWRPL